MNILLGMKIIFIIFKILYIINEDHTGKTTDVHFLKILSFRYFYDILVLSYFNLKIHNKKTML